LGLIDAANFKAQNLLMLLIQGVTVLVFGAGGEILGWIPG
jgi:hypothetical protein